MLFKNTSSIADQLVQMITFIVRLKLVTFKFKKVYSQSRLLLDQWKIPSFYFQDGGSTR